jgi:molecular chaperone DnaK (HSP70)
MKLGIDFGTTRIVVAAADRGNYPLVGFDAPDNQTREWFPPLIGLRENERLFGWDAWAVQADPEWTIVRSVKRLLKSAGPLTRIEIGARSVLVRDLLVDLLTAIRMQIRTASTLHASRGEVLEVMLGVPANANTNQRFLTADVFRAAGFQVTGMLNEPSAASVEFGHRERAARKTQPHRLLLVYDLGGGTFDASLVEMEADSHNVVASAGIPDLGGDDFDEILADLAMEAANIPEADRHSLSPAETFRLLDECRERKEALNPNTRKIVVDLDRVREGWPATSIGAAEFYERCRPLIERTEKTVEELLASYSDASIETLYVTGGGSELPAVSRVLKETFGRRVRRSAYMRSATAIGLAISADVLSGYLLRDRFAQYFGVWREADDGRNVSFDLLFPRGLELPRPGATAVRTTRSYRPAHNIGHFRYVECSRLADDGQPSGDLTVWDDIQFPFDPALRNSADLAAVPITRNGSGPEWIEEEYACDASGMVKVRISSQPDGYSREYSLGRWSERASETVKSAPSRKSWAQRRS